jgi:hypothetical protein
VDFFKDKKLNKNSYYKAWYEKYEDGVEVYNFIADYYDDNPNLKKLPLGQKLYHIIHNIDYIPEGLKFLSFKRGYTKGKVTFSGKSIEAFIDRLNDNQSYDGLDMSYKDTSSQLHSYIKRAAYTSLLNNTDLLYNIFKHTESIDDARYKIASLCNDSIYCSCGSWRRFKNSNTFYLNKTCGRKRCISMVLSDNIKARDLTYLQSDDIKARRVESRKDYRHSDTTKGRISASNKATWTVEKRQEQTNINKENGVYKRSSETMRQKILAGEYTPSTSNRYTRSKLSSDITGLSNYRSSWEVMFHEANPHLEYETVRIPYIYEGRSRVYIVDFCDQLNKILYEVKPVEFLNQSLVQAKLKAASSWCEDNKYTFEVITKERLCEKI